MTRRRRKPGASVPPPSSSPLPPVSLSPSPSSHPPSSSSSSSSFPSSSFSSSPHASASRAAAAVRPPPGISEFPSAAAAAPSTTVASSSFAAAGADSGSAAAAAGGRGSVLLSRRDGAAAVFLPGDPLLPLLLSEPEKRGRGEGHKEAAAAGEAAAEVTAAAVRRLAELVQQYDAESAAVAAATEAAAAAAETRAAASRAAAVAGGFSSSARQNPSSHVACIFTEKFPLFPYPPAYISCCMQRYEPLEGDIVLGLVNGKAAGEYYTVSIRARTDALLPQISAFEGATKQNRPRLRSGSIVLCRVERAAAAAAAQLTCIDINCKKAWHSVEKTFGELQGGCLLDVPPPLAISLMAPHCFVLGALGEKMKFEIATAANGRIWVKAQAAGDIVLIANVLLASYGKEPHVIQAIVNALLSRRYDKRKR